MSNKNTFPVTENKPDGRAGWLVRPGLAAALTLAASFGATYAANAKEDQGPIIPIATAERSDRPGAELSATFGVHDMMPGEVAIPGVGLRIDASTLTEREVQGANSFVAREREVVEQAHDVQKIQNMAWARLFSKDPSARETADAGGEVMAAAHTVQELIAQGYAINNITIHGFASDEDNTTVLTGKPGAGLGVDSEANVELAEERADAVHAMLREELAETMGVPVADTVPIEVTGGTEQRDDVLNSAIEALAEERGQSVQDLVVMYNRGLDTFAPTELEVLDQLKAQRYVLIEIDAQRATVRTDWIEQEGEWVMTTYEEDEGSIVVIPVLPLPILPRRHKSHAKPQDIQTDPVVPVVPSPSPSHPGTVRPEKARPPRSIGGARNKHGTPVSRRKQPAGPNDNGSGSTRGHRRLR